MQNAQVCAVRGRAVLSSRRSWPPPTVPRDGLGVSVAIFGSTAVVGASLENSKAGAAYVYVNL